MNHRKLEFSPYLQQTHFVMWHIHKEQLLNLSDKSEIRKKNHPKKKSRKTTTLLQFDFQLTQHCSIWPIVSEHRITQQSRSTKSLYWP